MNLRTNRIPGYLGQVSRRGATFLLAGFAGIFALGYVLTLPPFGWGDEVPHFLRAYRVSSGDLIATRDGDRRGTLAPPAVQRLLRSSGLTTMAWADCALKPSQSAPLFEVEVVPERTLPYQFVQEYGAPYPPLASAHTAPGVLLARSITNHPVYWLYGARLSGLLIWTAIGLWTLRLLPRLRLTIVALLLTPTALFLAATCSIDGLLDAVAFLWVAYVLKLCSEPSFRPSRKTIAVVVAFAIVLGAIKLVYAPLMLLLLFLPSAPGPASWTPWSRLAVLATLLGFLSAACWVAIAGGSPTDAVVFGEVENQVFDPLRVILQPAETLQAIGRTIHQEWYAWLVNLAWPKYTKCMALHDAAVPLVWGSLLLALIVDGAQWRPTPTQRCVGAGVFVSIAVTTLLVALATWTPDNASRVIGVHARYFLPALPALAVALLPPTNRLGARSRSILQGFVILGLLIANALVLIAFVRQYDWN